MSKSSIDAQFQRQPPDPPIHHRQYRHAYIRVGYLLYVLRAQGKPYKGLHFYVILILIGSYSYAQSILPRRARATTQHTTKLSIINILYIMIPPPYYSFEFVVCILLYPQNQNQKRTKTKRGGEGSYRGRCTRAKLQSIDT